MATEPAKKKLQHKRTNLGFNVQYTPSTLFLNVPHSLKAGPIKISSELSSLDEAVSRTQLNEFVPRNKMICNTIEFARPGVARCIFSPCSIFNVRVSESRMVGDALARNAEPKFVRMEVKEFLKEGALASPARTRYDQRAAEGHDGPAM